jgi:hypothetical protein
MELTEDMLRGAYAYLSETPPFNGWNLPDAEDVSFVVAHSRKRQGRCHVRSDGKFKIEISDRYHTHTQSLMQTMAHEMVHVHEFQNGLSQYWAHGKVFKALRDEVCVAHGFDPGQF